MDIKLLRLLYSFCILLLLRISLRLPMIAAVQPVMIHSVQIRDSSESTQIHQFIGYRGACLTGGMKFVVRPPFDRDTLNDCLVSCADAGKNCSFLVFHFRNASACEDLLGCSGVCYKFPMACSFAYWKENSQSFVAATYVKLNNHSSIGSDFAVSEFKGMEDMASFVSSNTAATASVNIDASLVSPATNDYIDSSNESVPATGGHAPSTKLQTDYNETLDVHNRTGGTLPHHHVTLIPAYSNFSQAHTPAVTVRRSNSQDQSTTPRQPAQIPKEMSFAESIQTAARAENRSTATNIEIDELRNTSPSFYQAVSDSLNQTGSASGHAEAHKSITFQRNESIAAVFGRTTPFTNDKDRYFRESVSAVSASPFVTFIPSSDTLLPDKQTIRNIPNKAAEQQSTLISSVRPRLTVEATLDRYIPDNGTFSGLKSEDSSSSLQNASNNSTTTAKNERPSTKSGGGGFDATSVAMVTRPNDRPRLHSETDTFRQHAPTKRSTGRPAKPTVSSSEAAEMSAAWNVSGNGASGQPPQTGELSQPTDSPILKPSSPVDSDAAEKQNNPILPTSAYVKRVTSDRGAASNRLQLNEAGVTAHDDADRFRFRQSQMSTKSFHKADKEIAGDGPTLTSDASQERLTSMRTFGESSCQAGQSGTVPIPRVDKGVRSGNEEKSLDELMRQFSMVVKRGVNKLTINSNSTESD